MPHRTLSFSRIESTPASTVCSICSAITGDRLRSEAGYPHASTIDVLKENGDNGCSLCNELFRAVCHLEEQRGRLFLSLEPSEFEEQGQQLIYRFGGRDENGPIIWESIPSRRPSDKSSRNRFADGICVYTEEGRI
jgi:hypothetical protein